MPTSKQGSTKLLRISELLYVALAVSSFYLLVVSRSDEAYTVWQVLHPAFMPTLFVATSLLLVVLCSSAKLTHKMVLVIVHSILLHSFFPIVFPAGDVSGQQIVLGRTRRVFDNTVLHGLSGWPTQTLQIFLVEMFDGINFQAALSTIFARMLSIDIFYVHLFLVPVLWGVFIPIASFLTTKTLGGDEKTSVLASLLVSAFPYANYFGAISVPNSIGFIFFFFSLYFMLKHLTSQDSKITYWMITFSIFSFLSHYLTGVMAFSLLLLTVAFKAYQSEKESPSVSVKASLMVSFLFCASLLPLSFIYLRAFGTTANPVFTLDKLYELPFEEIVGLFLLGELTYGFDLRAVFLIVIGPVLGLLWMIYLLYKLRRNPTATFRTQLSFLFAAFILVLADYRVLKLFMKGLPLNAERLWVLRDFLTAPSVALAICATVSSLTTSLKANSLPTTPITKPKKLSSINILRGATLLLTLNILISLVLGGWITASLSTAYPQVAPLQTTSYELEAVRYIEENTVEKYVVIGDIWTAFAGGMIVGTNNPDAFYFGEHDPRGYTLFAKMSQEPSHEMMMVAMNQTGADSTVAYFIVTEPRLGTEEFNDVVSRTQQEEQITLLRTFGEGKLYVFRYRKG